MPLAVKITPIAIITASIIIKNMLSIISGTLIVKFELGIWVFSNTVAKNDKNPTTISIIPAISRFIPNVLSSYPQIKLSHVPKLDKELHFGQSMKNNFQNHSLALNTKRHATKYPA